MECTNSWQQALGEKFLCKLCEFVFIGVSPVCVCGVNEAVCVCVSGYVFVHTSHLHGAMPHRFHWGV